MKHLRHPAMVIAVRRGIGNEITHLVDHASRCASRPTLHECRDAQKGKSTRGYNSSKANLQYRVVQAFT